MNKKFIILFSFFICFLLLIFFTYSSPSENSEDSKILLTCPSCGYRCDTDWAFCISCGFEFARMAMQSNKADIDKKALILAQKAVFGIERLWKKKKKTYRKFRSGWLYDDKGHIVTSAYYLDKVDTLKVRFWNNEEREAKLIGRDYASGIGVIKIEGDLPDPLVMGESQNCDIGDSVWLIGFPIAERGKDFYQKLPQKVSKGTLSDRNKTNINYLQIENYLQCDIGVDYNLYGGSLLNASGEIIGMVAKSLDEGICLSSPVKLLKESIDAVIKAEPLKRGYLGIGIGPITPFLKEKFQITLDQGIVVEYVISSSPADKAGIKKGDIIQQIDGKVAETSFLCQQQVMKEDIGKEFELSVLRDQEVLQFQVKSEERPEEIFMRPFDEIEQYYGMHLIEQTEGFVSQQGLKIVNIIPGSLAESKEFEIGDLIYKIDDKYMVSAEKDFNKILEKEAKYSKGNSFYVSFKIRKKDGEKNSFSYLSYYPRNYEPTVM